MLSEWAQLQVGVAVAALLIGGLKALLPTRPAAMLWGARALVFAAFIAPLWPQGSDRPFAPPIQVWASAGRSASAEPVVSLPALVAPIPLTPALDLAWLGVLAVGAAGAGYLLYAVLGLRRLLQDTVPYRRVGRVHVVVSPHARSPCAAWLGRAYIVLDLATFSHPEARQLAILHELQHHRQRDPLWAWAPVLAGVLLFFNPFFGLLRRQLVELEELACDAALVATGRINRRAYAEGLLAAAERASAAPVWSALIGSSSLLVRRVSMLLKPVSPSPLRAAVHTLLVLLAAPLLVVTARASDTLVADYRVDGATITAIAARLDPRTDLPVVANAQVQNALQRFVATPSGRRWVQQSLARSAVMRPQFEAALMDAGLPRELAAVPLVESGYQNLNSAELSPAVPPHQRGAGYWMFIPSTARRYGLQVDATVDERLDIDAETGAAISLLSDLYERYGDWGLALAGYNQGENHVDAAIRDVGSRDVWALIEAGALNDYVPQVMAAVILLEEPGLVE